ncbi:MAG TPA: dephospho-CoA kinase [Bacteroidia bacterium]|jgi:dephospho-CoA kinase|nr:dephospho-CoA kinase [Bacteroidia bacterium]
MKKIGLTGGIGSGKSVIAEIFRVLGVPVFNSDRVAREIQDEDEAVVKQIKKLLGDDVYVEGKLERLKVAQIVFADKNKLEKLNAIVHPAVAKAFTDFCASHSGKKYVIKEAAILIEIGDTSVDKMILVTAPEDVRIERIIQRDGISEEEIHRRMKNQWNDEQKMKKADVVLVNDGKEMLLEKVLELHKEFSS